MGYGSVPGSYPAFCPCSMASDRYVARQGPGNKASAGSQCYTVYAGFHTEVGGVAGLPPSHNSPPPPEILKLREYGVLSQVLDNNLVPDYVRSNLRGSKFKIEGLRIRVFALTKRHEYT